MATTLLIHIREPQRDWACWGLVNHDDPTQVEALGSGSLAEAAAAAQGQRSLIALGSRAITLTRAQVPGNGGKRTRAAIPYALEEQLADDVEELHFALGPVGSDGGYPVAVVARATVQQLLADCAEHGLYPRQVVPDVLLLPPGDSDEWEVLQSADDLLVRQGNYGGLWCPADSAELMLGRLLREVGVDGPTQITFYLEPGQEPPEVDTLVERVDVQSSVEALARGLSAPQIDLLQGEFNQSAEMGKLWKPWRLPAALAACLLLLDIGTSVLQNNRLVAQEADQRAQMEALLKQAFPEIKRVRDPISRMRSELRKLKTGGAKGELMPFVAALSQALQGVPGTAIKSVNFRNGRADVEMQTDSLQTLDKIKQSLDSTQRIKATIQSANQQGGSVRGRLRIEAG